MLKTLTATAITVLAAAPFALAGTKNIDAAGFDQIEAKGAMNVIYTSGPQTSVILETDGDDFSDADISVDGDTLVITRVSLNKRGLFGGGASLRLSDDGKTVRVNGKKKPYYKVRITSPDLNGIRVAQSSTADATGIDAATFEARVSSAATLKLSGRAVSAEMSASSSGEIEAGSFAAETLTLNASSSGEIDAFASGSGTVDVSASSSGEVSLRSTGPAVFDMNASSGAEIEAAGSCASLSVTASSGAEVDASKLRCETATIDASSGADVDAFASVSASGDASSGADITIDGRPPQQQADTTSGGDVTFN